MNTTDLINALLNGLSNSSILILTALGLSITFGVMKVINMAHGDMLMLGAYTAYVVTDRDGLTRWIDYFASWLGLELAVEPNLFWAIPITFVVVGGFGYLLEVSLIRHLYGRPLDTLLATWGLGLVLQQTVSNTLGPDMKPLSLPAEVSGSLQIGQIAFPYFRMFILAITVLCILAVYFWFYRTTFGLQIRAVTQNRQMAAALGISTRKVDSLTFAFGTGLAGVAGCIFGHLYVVSSDMGNSYIVDAFMVVILGGMGSFTGTIVGGIIIGTGQSIVAKYLSTSGPLLLREVDGPMSRVAILVVIVAFILIKPSGLFPTKERKYD